MIKKVIVAVVGLLLALPLVASAQQSTPNSPKRVLNVTEQIVVGNKTIEPGQYAFQCVMIDGVEYLRVTSGNKTEIARVPCKPSSLASKAEVSLYQTVPGPNGTRVLQSVQLKGDSAAHVVVQSAS